MLHEKKRIFRAAYHIKSETSRKIGEGWNGLKSKEPEKSCCGPNLLKCIANKCIANKCIGNKCSIRNLHIQLYLNLHNNHGFFRNWIKYDQKQLFYVYHYSEFNQMISSYICQLYLFQHDFALCAVICFMKRQIMNLKNN